MLPNHFVRRLLDRLSISFGARVRSKITTSATSEIEKVEFAWNHPVQVAVVWCFSWLNGLLDHRVPIFQKIDLPRGIEGAGIDMPRVTDAEPVNSLLAPSFQ